MDLDLTAREATTTERPEVAELTKLAYAEYATTMTPELWAGYERSIVTPTPTSPKSWARGPGSARRGGAAFCCSITR